ncbi:hypothetical protein [Kineococcus rhizosphaerae]|uniref:Uncharacterized protein n=1 Tax=Kineococcus rhizosphaerae TaxID=559628 RepID=A0A2T0QY75_9ACTN|nr:hypothetical protein [Kineococcus rhizosphaerae]PRY11147.1 hypothetical protein CLV37_114101 [Kineococcus rhizosphaerae]
MEPLRLARALAVVDIAAAGAATGLAQWAYDLPTRRRRLAAQVGLGLVFGGAVAASDAVWRRATADRARPVDPDVVPAHETALALRHLGLSAAGIPVWVLGRGLPERMRRRGLTRPNRLLALPVALGWAAAAAPVEWAHARDRAAALDL